MTVTIPVAIARVFLPWGKLLRTIGRIFITGIGFCDKAVEGRRFCFLPRRFECPRKKILNIHSFLRRGRLIVQGGAERLNGSLIVSRRSVTESNLRLGFQP